MDGAQDRLRAEHNGRAWLAWHVAHLPGNEKVRLRDLLIADKPAAKAAGWQDEYAAFAAWATRH